MHNEVAVRALVRWLPLALAASILCALGYALVQQDLRQGANDPQIQIAEDLAASLADGATLPGALPGASRVDLSTSLAPFVIVYTASGSVASSTGQLDGAVPQLPSGVLAAAAHHEDRLTWQPAPGVRVAAVVVRYGGEHPGFVLAGRSLREVERRETASGATAFAAWLLTIVVTFGACCATAWVERATGERWSS